MLKALKEDAYAGSWQDFDKFSRNYILSGESNLAYGYGFYFALDPDVALRYQKKSSAQRTLKCNGIPIKNFNFKGIFDWNNAHYDKYDIIDLINNDLFNNKKEYAAESNYFIDLIFFGIVYSLTKDADFYIPNSEDSEECGLCILKRRGPYVWFEDEELFYGSGSCNYSVNVLYNNLKKNKEVVKSLYEQAEKEYTKTYDDEYSSSNEVECSYSEYVNYGFILDCINAAIDFIDNNKFEIDSGVTKKVKIPDNEFLLIEYKKYNDQSNFVKSALDKMYQRFCVDGLSLRFFLPDLKDISLTNLKGWVILTIDPDADIRVPNSANDEFDEDAVNKTFEKYETEILIKYFNQDNKNTKITKEILFKELLKAKIKPFPEDYKDYYGYGLIKGMTNRINFYYSLSEKHDKNYAKKIVSQLFHSVGIKGFQYEGTIDGKCIVVFDPDDIEIIESFYDRNLITLKPINEK